MRPKIIILSSVLLLTLILGACSFPKAAKKTEELKTKELEDVSETIYGSEDLVLSSANLKKFKNHDEFQEFLADVNLKLDDFSMPDNAADLNPLLELDVNGADIIRQGGGHTYALVRNDVYIIKTSPVAEARALVKLSFPDQPSMIYLSNDRLVVIGADSQIMASSVYAKFKRQSPYTYLKIYDVSNPEEANEIRTLNFEGSYYDSRLIANNLYLFIDNYREHEIKESLSPRLVDGNSLLSSSCETGKKCYAPEIYYFDIPYDSYRLFSVNSLDLSNDDASVTAQSYLLSDSQKLHLAANNLYLSSSQSLNETELRSVVLREIILPRLSGAEKKSIISLESLANTVFSNLDLSENSLKIYHSYISSQPRSEREILEKEISAALKKTYEQEADNLERSTIYRFSLSQGSSVFRAQAVLKGLLLNDHSLYEDTKANLQVITRTSIAADLASFKKKFYSNLYTLNSALKPIASLEKFSDNDKYSSIKYIGDMAFLYGANETDLEIIDLKNALAPKFLGAASMPAAYHFLSYYKENILIGLGEATEADAYGNEKSIGLKLSLLDFNNPLKPQELNSYIIGANNSRSILLDSRSPFLFSLDKNILSIPASLTSPANTQQPYFSGSLIFTIDNNIFELKGQIDHSDGGRYRAADYTCGQNCFDNSVKRSYYLNDNLYTFSNKYLKINRLADLSPIQAIKLIADTELDLNFIPLDVSVAEQISEPNPELMPDNLNPLGPVFEAGQEDMTDSLPDKAETETLDGDEEIGELPPVDNPAEQMFPMPGRVN